MGLGDLVGKKARLADTTEQDGVGGKETLPLAFLPTLPPSLAAPAPLSVSHSTKPKNTSLRRPLPFEPTPWGYILRFSL
jgi:hypothetical protein